MFVGVDGCPAGWFSITLVRDGKWTAELFSDISTLWDGCTEAELILVDIPIGLRENGKQERMCDLEARKLLSPYRRGSVFPVPCRAALYIEEYGDASRINFNITGRRLSRQSWNIMPKIRQMDQLLNDVPRARTKIREIHPEICFHGLAGRPMIRSKRTAEGLLERLDILASVCGEAWDIYRTCMAKYRRAQVARDDILDALVGAVMARAGEENLTTIPEEPQRDERGLPMEMVYWPYQTSSYED